MPCEAKAALLLAVKLCAKDAFWIEPPEKPLLPNSDDVVVTVVEASSAPPLLVVVVVVPRFSSVTT